MITLKHQSQSRKFIPLGINVSPLALQTTKYIKYEQKIDFKQYDLPPAALAPLTSQEPCRADILKPLHVRASGLSWPPEAFIDIYRGSARLPAAYAWPMLCTNQSQWRYTSSADELSLHPSDALAAIVGAAAQVNASVSDEQNEILPTIIIPNSLSVNSQQSLLDSLALIGLRSQLLWRPIAAAMVWCVQNERSILASIPPSTNKEHQIIGQLPVFYLGLDTLELSILSLVVVNSVNGQRLVPGRHRPHKQDSFHGVMLQYLESSIHEALNHLNEEKIIAEWWNYLWCRDSSQRLLKYISGTLGNIREQEDVRSIWGRVLKKPLSDANKHPLSPINPDIELTKIVKIWQQRLASTENNHWLGTVICGDCTSVQIQNKVLADTCLKLIDSQSLTKDRIIISSNLSPEDNHSNILTSGALLYQNKLDAGEPPYLDTLPQLKVAAQTNGEPTWVKLLDEAFVEGGRTWERTSPLTGLSIRSGRNELQVPLDHEEFTTIREVTAPVPNPPEHDLPVSLHVSMTPASGNATIRVVPSKAPHDRHVSDIRVNWASMTELRDEKDGHGLTADEWLKLQPRAYPELLKRGSSNAGWREVKWAWEQFAKRKTEDNLKNVYVKLQQKRDPDYYQATLQFKESGERKQTAVSSDGTVSLDNYILRSIIESLVTELIKGEGHGILSLDHVVRTLAYCSAEHETLENWLKEVITKCGTRLEQYHLAAIGWCLRDPKTISLFAEVLDLHLRKKKNVNNWLKAFSEILRYRDDACSEISVPIAENITQHALAILQEQCQKGQAAFLFRYSALCIVYLLRIRKYQHRYIEPQSSLAEEAKQIFHEAINASKKKKLSIVGGTFNVERVLETLIRYIDREGPALLDANLADLIA